MGAGSRPIEVCFVYFRSCTLVHLDAAWYALSRQNFSQVRRVLFLDNNSPDAPEAIQAVLDRYPIPVPLVVCYAKHGDASRTHSWSLNTVCRAADGPWIFFTRADYILAFDCLEYCWARAQQLRRAFVSGWRRDLRPAPDASPEALIDIEATGWREKGMAAFMRWPHVTRFSQTHRDAGTWLTRRKFLEQAGWADERLVLWGYQQAALQADLSRKARVTFCVVRRYLFAHHHHYFSRSRREGRAQLAEVRGGE